MLVFTETGGFYSAAVDEKDPGRRVVRSRDRGSLEHLADWVLWASSRELEIEDGTGTDYRYRARVSADEWAGFLGAKARGARATNVKDEAAANLGPDHPFVDLLYQVWSAGWDYQSAMEAWAAAEEPPPAG